MQAGLRWHCPVRRCGGSPRPGVKNYTLVTQQLLTRDTVAKFPFEMIAVEQNINS